jgi:hypothetical protein
MVTDDLFEGCETICSTLTGLWYGKEELGYPAQVMSHTFAASLSALVATGKDHHTLIL